MRALIDADSLIYIIAWHHREFGAEATEQVKASCDTFLKDILTITRADDYIGVFSTRSFRYERYHYALYKGNRPEKEDWMKLWEPIIKEHYIAEHGFFSLVGLEADDVVAAGSILLQHDGHPCVICSPDKDLRQVMGMHYNYKPAKNTDGLEIMLQTIETVTAVQAHRTFWKQVIMGDAGDNIKGVPGLGDKKVDALLDAALDDIQYQSIAREAYIKYFGDHYGKVIFRETLDAVLLITPGHSLWEPYKPAILEALAENIRTLKPLIGYFGLPE